MSRILFRRVADGELVGEIRRAGAGALTATGGAVSLLEAARRRGEPDTDVYSRHASWSNGVFSSREEEVAVR